MTSQPTFANQASNAVGVGWSPFRTTITISSRLTTAAAIMAATLCRNRHSAVIVEDARHENRAV